MPGTRGSRLLRYAFAFAAVALATALRFLLDPLLREQAPYTACFLAIALTAWYGGMGPSLLALAASAGVSTYLFVPPRGSFLVHGVEDQSALALFLLTGAVVTLLSNLQRAGRRRAEGSVVSLKDSESQLLGLVEEIEKVMEVAPAAILVALDPACQRIRGNRAASELYGVSGKLNFSLTPPLGEPPAPHRYFSGGKELRGGDLPMQRAAARNKDIRDIEMQVVRQDGAQITLFGGATPLHDEHGRVRGCIAAFVDITARKKAEESLRKLSQAVEQSPVNVIITDLNGNIEYVNRRFVQVTGYTSAESLGKNPRILKSGHTSDEEYRTLWQTITAGGDWSGEFLNKAKDGSLFWERALITSIKDEAGRISHFLAVKEDITERKQAEEALQQMRLQLTHVARLSTLGEMAAELAHELNHPLYAILNYAKAVRNVLGEEGPPDLERVREWNEEIADIALSAAEVVKRLRSFARRGQALRSVCRVEEVAAEALGLVAVELRRARVAVETCFSAASPPLRADRVQIQQVFVNLLSNAIEAMHGVAPDMRRITIQTLLGDGVVEVVVSDCGVGLPPASETNIFEPYVTTKPQGLGMGLTIVRTIVEAHGGRLWATPNPEGGAAFHFTLPFGDGGRPDDV
ncbi:MAG: PAS domain S-box protein [Thermoguttaceae bacterium]|jgi:PAS domain S-box-containing protein